jgi:hypothetical protein
VGGAAKMVVGSQVESVLVPVGMITVGSERVELEVAVVGAEVINVDKVDNVADDAVVDVAVAVAVVPLVGAPSVVESVAEDESDVEIDVGKVDAVDAIELVDAIDEALKEAVSVGPKLEGVAIEDDEVIVTLPEAVIEVDVGALDEMMVAPGVDVIVVGALEPVDDTDTGTVVGVEISVAFAELVGSTLPVDGTDTGTVVGAEDSVAVVVGAGVPTELVVPLVALSPALVPLLKILEMMLPRLVVSVVEAADETTGV